MRRVSVWLKAWCCGLTLLACGGKWSASSDIEPTRSAGSGNEGASSNLGASTSIGATSPMGATANVGASSSVGGSAPSTAECAAFEDEVGWSLLVHFSNKTGQTIHLGQREVTCGFEPLFRVTNLAPGS